MSSPPLVSLLDQARVEKSSLIRVVGPHGLPALLWLCRHGYEQVGYLRPGQGCPHEQPDAILVAHACDPAWLDSLLAVGPHVREGGVLIFQASAALNLAAVDRLLRCHAYVVERSLRGAHRDLHVARRAAQTLRKAA